MFRLRVLGLAGLSMLTLISCGSPTQPGPMTFTVQVADFSYSPQSVKVNPGDTVRWVLASGSMTNHTVTDTTDTPPFDSGFLPSGGSFQHTFTATDAGKTFNYLCKTHGGSPPAPGYNMKGDVRVGASAPPPGPGY